MYHIDFPRYCNPLGSIVVFVYLNLSMQHTSTASGITIPGEDCPNGSALVYIDRTTLSLNGPLIVRDNGQFTCSGTGDDSELILGPGSSITTEQGGVIDDNCGRWTIRTIDPSVRAAWSISDGPSWIGATGGVVSRLENIDISINTTPNARLTIEHNVAFQDSTVTVNSGALLVSGDFVEETASTLVVNSPGSIRLITEGAFSWSRVDDASNPILINGGLFTIDRGYTISSHILSNGTGTIEFLGDDAGDDESTFELPLIVDSPTADVDFRANANPVFNNAFEVRDGTVTGTSTITGGLSLGGSGSVTMTPQGEADGEVGALDFGALVFRSGQHRLVFTILGGESYSSIHADILQFESGATVLVEIDDFSGLEDNALEGAAINLVTWDELRGVSSSPFSTNLTLVESYCPDAWIDFDESSGYSLKCFPPPPPDTDDDGTESNLPIPLIASVAGGLVLLFLIGAAMGRSSAKSSDPESSGGNRSRQASKAKAKKAGGSSAPLTKQKTAGAGGKNRSASAGRKASKGSSTPKMIKVGGVSNARTIDQAINILLKEFTIDQLNVHVQTMLRAGEAEGALALALGVEKAAVGGPAGIYEIAVENVGLALEAASVTEAQPALKAARRATKAMDASATVKQSLLTNHPAMQRATVKFEPILSSPPTKALAPSSVRASISAGYQLMPVSAFMDKGGRYSISNVTLTSLAAPDFELG